MTSEGQRTVFDDTLVSVIIPVYNCEKFIRQTIDSVLAQGFGPMEVILIDDKSTDSSLAILQEYAKKNSNIVVHEQAENAGAAVARNTGLALAKGRYIAFLDSDDIWLDGKLKAEMDLMTSENTPLVFTAMKVIDEDGKESGKIRKVPKKATYRTVLRNTVISTSTVLLDRKIFGDFRMPLLRSGQDYATWLMLLRNGATARGINTPLACYRVRKKSLSANKFSSIEQVYTIQTKFEKINRFLACCHVLSFCFHAIVKRFI
jgi:teichuronic acid biosynthesis glycosyltransferase TuaG